MPSTEQTLKQLLEESKQIGLDGLRNKTGKNHSPETTERYNRTGRCHGACSKQRAEKGEPQSQHNGA